MQVNGLYYLPYDSSLALSYNPVKLWEKVYQEEWCYDIKRRTQHYGYKYDYKLRRINEKQKTKPMTPWLQDLANEVGHAISHTVPNAGWAQFDQCIINEYQEGQGIAPHIDCQPCFEDIITTLSLGSEYVMDFMNWKTKDKFKLPLEVGSLLILSGEARYDWTHALKPQKGTRVSITFRKVILD